MFLPLLPKSTKKQIFRKNRFFIAFLLSLLYNELIAFYRDGVFLRMLDFIINERAGNGKALSAKNQIQKILEEKGIPHRFHFTERSKHAIEISREICLAGGTDVIAMGGDGTMNEVLNGLTNLETVRYGIIPCGSGNDFAGSANIPLDVSAALDIILNGTTKPTDFLVCDGVRGLNAIGTGIDVEILRRCEKSKILKGKLKYFNSLLISLIKFKFYEFFNEKLPPEQKKARKTLIVCCGNGKKIGGGIPICPEASIDDGKMDLVIVNELKRIRIPGALIKLMKGKILKEDFCDFSLEDDVSFSFSNSPAIQIDGEIYENLKFDIHVEKRKLNLYRP